jgi:phage protein D
MEALEKDYDLEADDSKVIARQIKDLDEGGYDAWLEDFKVFAKEKSKDYKALKAEEMKKQKEEEAEAATAKASTEEAEEQKESREKEEAEKLIASAQEDVKQEVASTQHEEKVSLTDQFKDFELELAGK